MSDPLWDPGGTTLDACCEGTRESAERLAKGQASTLSWVLLLNAGAFVGEVVAGVVAGSVALLADSSDMLGDALVYGVSLVAVGRGVRWKAWAAVAKASAMGLFGMFLAFELVRGLLAPHPPSHGIMGGTAILALAVNAACFVLLRRHRADDINMRSVWLCSRNDIASDGAVLLAAFAVWALRSPWPDLAVGAAICLLFLGTAAQVAREARGAIREAGR